MSTPAQILANRQNALRSTGPRTEAGKSTVSRNAVSHGLASANVVLASEDPAQFEALLCGLDGEFAPTTHHEFLLVQQMAQARWRLARIRRIETAAFNNLLGDAEPADADACLAVALMQSGTGFLAKLERYAASAERSYFKAHKELVAAIEARQKNDARHKKQAPAPVHGKMKDSDLLDLLLRVPDCKTKPNAAIPELDDLDDDELLEALTRPPTAATSSAKP